MDALDTVEWPISESQCRAPLLDRRLHKLPQGGLVHLFQRVNLHMAELLSGPIQQGVRVGQRSTVVESQIDIIPVDADVRISLAHLLRPHAVTGRPLPRSWHLDS